MPSITTWTRLEPRSRSEAIQASLQARVYDPLWMLARQWQFGEFQGEDNGSPVAVQLQAEQSQLSLFSPGRPQRLPIKTDASPYDSTLLPLETMVEREKGSVASTDHFRNQVESGLHFIRLLGVTLGMKYRTKYLDAYPIDPLTTEQRQGMDADSIRYHDVFARRTVNGSRLYTDMKKGMDTSTGILKKLPAQPLIDPADQAQVIKLATEWLSWYESLVSRPDPSQPADTWKEERMEYDFATAAAVSASPGVPNGQLVIVAPEYQGGHLDWYSFSVDHQTYLSVTGWSPSVKTINKSVLPTQVSFPGMPSSRWWEFENANVNIGAIDSPPDDLVRMLMMEFMLVYSNDFFLIPMDLDVGSICQISSLRVWNTFGEEVRIDPVSKTEPAGKPWRMFQLSQDTRSNLSVPNDPLNLFFLPPVLGPSLEGSPLEEVHLLRDETANMAWGVEMVVESPAGLPLNRHEDYQDVLRRKEMQKEIKSSGVTATRSGPLEYRVSTVVPDHWVPFVPVRPPGSTEEARTIGLKRGTVLHPESGQLIQPIGKILAADPLIIKEEEVPREGIKVSRAYQYARWINGEPYLWIGRRKSVGHGEGGIGLRFDVAEPGEQF
uniref:Uncharacterized protein n=1 Tax=Neobacillus citreus TaxID=2833578 RepID=A0A942T4T6_9BACI